MSWTLFQAAFVLSAVFIGAGAAMWIGTRLPRWFGKQEQA